MEKKNNNKYYTITQLKKILKKANLPPEGNRDEVLQRIYQNNVELQSPSDSEDIPYVAPKEDKKWQWYDSAQWRDYDEETSSLIEKAFLNKDKDITLSHGFFGKEGGYRINFKKKTQTKLSSGYCRAVRRYDNQSSVSSEDEEGEDDINEDNDSVEDDKEDEDEDNDEDTSSPPTTPIGQMSWQWLDDSGWKNYDTVTEDILSKAHQNGQQSVILKHGFFAKSKGGYTIDFNQMLQTNNGTGYVRNIRRLTDSKSKTKTKSKIQTKTQPPPSNFNFFPSITPPFVPLNNSLGTPLKKDKSMDVTWEYQNTDNNWQLFEPTVIKLIEGMYSRGTMSINLHFGEWVKNPCTVNITDLNMKENNNTEQIYSLRRNPPINKKKHHLSNQDHKKTKKHKTEHKVIESPSPSVNTENEKICEKLTGWVPYEIKPQDQCPICFESYPPDSDVILLKCSHHFCKSCIMGCYTQGFILCPMCKTCYGIRVGSMPDGKLKIDHLAVGKCPLSGFESNGTYRLRMSFPDGVQGEEHPNPGQSFEGTSRTAYLPDTPEGKEVLNLIKTAWDRKLLFRIGTSVTTGADNQVIWNGIHMKTQTHGGATNFGYPDETYFQRVKKELADKGIL